jgi:hypothetical protein
LLISLNSNDIKTIHEQKVNRAFINNLTVHPYIAIVGNIEDASRVLNYYSVIYNIYYITIYIYIYINILETPIKTLDICVKSFHALNLNYPPEAEQVWWFIQDYFFEIANVHKKKFVAVQTLIKDFQ